MKKTLFLLPAFFVLTVFQGCKSLQLPFGKDLNVTTLLGQAVPAGVNMGFKFDKAGKKITGKAGCNSFAAPYKLKGSKLRFDTAMSTKLTCPNQDWENKFMSMLSQVEGIEQVGDKFNLTGAGKVLASLSE